MTDEEKAEEYIIAKYKLNKCYIEDTEETRVYMRNNVHSEYQQEYECYLDGLAEGRKETEAHLLDNWCRNEEGYCPHLNRLEKENAELQVFSKKLIEINNKLRNSLRKYEVVPDVDYLPNGIEIYKENVGNNPYSKED